MRGIAVAMMVLSRAMQKTESIKAMVTMASLNDVGYSASSCPGVVVSSLVDIGWEISDSRLASSVTCCFSSSTDGAPLGAKVDASDIIAVGDGVLDLNSIFRGRVCVGGRCWERN